MSRVAPSLQKSAFKISGAEDDQLCWLQRAASGDLQESGTEKLVSLLPLFSIRAHINIFSFL